MADLDLVLSLSLPTSQEDAPATHQALKGALQRAGPDLRTLQVTEKGNWAVGVLGGGPHVDRRLAVGRLVAMREVQAGDIHAGLQQVAQHLRRGAGRPDRANDSRAPNH